MKMTDFRLADMQRLARLGEEAARKFIADMRPEDVLKLDDCFEAWAQDGQIAPKGEHWRCWLLMAGRGFGKTRAGAEWVHGLAMSAKRRRIALVAGSIEEARSVMVEGASGLVLVAARNGVRLKWEAGELVWPNGSRAALHSGDSPERLRGPNFHFAWADELAKWRCAESAWANLQMGLRLGMRPRVLVTTTPRPRPLIEAIRGDEGTVETGGRTGDNVSLPPAFIDAMARAYGGTRIGRQELDGEYLGEAEGALFPRALIEAARVAAAPEAFERVVVGVDPPAGEHGDGCGIVVAGRVAGTIHVLADASVGAGSPERWARVAVAAAREWGASHIVAEANQGGAMVKSVLKAAGAELPVRLVHATSGKAARAEPVAVRMETGRVKLAGTFPALEAELSGMGSGGAYDGPGRSPDRADAMVWAVTELSETRSGVPRVRML